MIFGCGSVSLSGPERRFYREADPWGFILFRRNCESPRQVKRLTAELRDSVGRPDCPILIDQEGGRVQRLAPPSWPALPAAGRFGELARADLAGAEAAVHCHALAMAASLAELGISVDAFPVLDLAVPGASPVIGDRAFSQDPLVVARLGRAACEGLLDGGILPIIKHLPGHGRATVDSHQGLPIIDADRATLERWDFEPFRALSGMPWGMTGHLVLSAVDPAAPVTLSATAIGDVIRGAIGFDGVLISDDLSMGALQGPAGGRARAALAAGCDLALHCNGDMAEMIEVADAVPPVGRQSLERLAMAEAARRRPQADLDPDALRARVRALLAEG